LFPGMSDSQLDYVAQTIWSLSAAAIPELSISEA
jgi:hypothetical protein